MQHTSKVSLLIALLAVLIVQPAFAMTYTVTSTSWKGPGSLFEAIEMANANPGPDVIEFTPGLKIDTRPEGESYLGISDPRAYVLAEFTDELIIDGKGGELFTAQAWANPGGGQVFGQCPKVSEGYVLFTTSPGLFTLGKYQRDNSDVKVTIKNLDIRGYNHLAQVQKNASLIMENVHVSDIWAIWKCTPVSMIQANDGANVTLRDSVFRNTYSYLDGGPLDAIGFPAIFGGGAAGDLLIEGSEFAGMFLTSATRTSTVIWFGQENSTVNVVSSFFTDTGGVIVDADAETNIVNSIWNNDPTGDWQTADRFINRSTGDMNIIASTLMWNSDQCSGCDRDSVTPALQPDFFWREDGFGGKINFLQSAVGINFPVPLGTTPDPQSDFALTLRDGGTGGFSADKYTWMQTTIRQDATELEGITGQSLLLTDPPPAFDNELITSLLVPLVNPLAGGPLIDVVPDAGSGGANELKHPVTGAPIALDALGNPRVEEVAAGDFRRNIGAIQLTLDPHLSLKGTDSASVTVQWTKPLTLTGVTYTGYFLEYREVGAVSWTRIAVGSNLDTLEYEVTGLTNGTAYEFRVAAKGTSDLGEAYTGPWSNVVTATPFGLLGTPVVTAIPGDGEVALSWPQPDLGGREFGAYTILWRVFGTDTYTGAQAIYDPGQTAITITGLKNGTKYKFAVAVNASGQVSEQGIATATPHADIGIVDRSPDATLPATKEANRPKYWEREPYSYGDCTKYEVGDDFGSVWEVMDSLSALILKTDLTNDVWESPAPGFYGTASAKDISHAIVCY